METASRFLQFPTGSCFLFGPRGTGKTTWLRQLFPGALWIDLLQPASYRELSAHPEILVERVRAAPAGVTTIIIDEVQRVPELLTVVHELIEADRSKRFILTGSSARKLRRGGVDLLAGRAVVRELHPFMLAELSDSALEPALERGLIPLVVAAADPHDALSAYATLYLEEEVRTEGWVRNIGSFARFLEAVSFSHGSVLNVTNVARDCHVERKTVAGYLEVLADLLLSFQLDVFTRRARRELVAHRKFYLFDAGVFRSLRPRGPVDRATEIDGAALEGLVAQHLRAWLAYSGRDLKLYYWRTRSGTEIDFVLYGGDGLWAIEVKNLTTIRQDDLRALKAFRTDYPECEALLLYRGVDRRQIGDVLCLPVAEFLSQLHPARSLIAGHR